MAGWLILLYLLVIAGLFGVAIYEHQTATSLYLPVSSTLTILIILLPILSPLNTIYYHQSISPSQSPQTPPLSLPAPNSASSLTNTPNNIRSTSPPKKKVAFGGALQITQLSLTIFLLATFLSLTGTATDGASSVITDCLLSSKWKSLWTSHNADAIKQIQDVLSCCGFRSVKDMSYPFPSGSPNDGKKHVDCVARYGRHTPCLDGWEGELRSLVGGEVGVLIVTGLLQALGWYLAGRITKTGNGNRTFGEVVKRLLGGIARGLRGIHVGERQDRGREWDHDESSSANTNTGSRRGANSRGGHGRGGAGRGQSRLLVGGGEVERLVKVDDEDDDGSTGERDMGRDVERGHGRDGYGTAGTGAGGNVWRSG